ncbi:MAG: hypothetical protein D3904_10475 [Candidatus Electrothrix sp. EH2]|nr:hypothetical protein [Candidatus Electrothrix sp. EH2]
MSRPAGREGVDTESDSETLSVEEKSCNKYEPVLNSPCIAVYSINCICVPNRQGNFFYYSLNNLFNKYRDRADLMSKLLRFRE